MQSRRRRRALKVFERYESHDNDHKFKKILAVSILFVLSVLAAIIASVVLTVLLLLIFGGPGVVKYIYEHPDVKNGYIWTFFVGGPLGVAFGITIGAVIWMHIMRATHLVSSAFVNRVLGKLR